MNLIIFILILGILIFIHELGHFLCAKLFKIRVDEFGFGYPPRMFTIGHYRETKITMNWIPFGGFVKIFGESNNDTELNPEDKKVSLVYKPRWQQVLVMLGGVFFNIIFAWMLFSGLSMSGVTTSIENIPSGYTPSDTQLLISGVMGESPADNAGLISGDEIKEYFNSLETVTVTNQGISDIATFINKTGEMEDTINFVILRENKLKVINVEPKENFINNNYGIGINAHRVGQLKLSFHQALLWGAKNTIAFTGAIFEGFWQLITGKISTDNVSGPVGIVKQVGEASKIGISYLVGFTALLSINLAVLNLIPFPALDGGRVCIIAIESIIQKRLKPIIVAWINTIGFFALILLMIIITVKDIINLF